ncbi:hypothetical protein M1D49_12330 [Bacillus sp. PK3-056]|uniref:hypothetical protein n=1 Tax=Niallia circulans TaxID=1397 RepID=UPI000F45D2C9|nr:hypothetical protein [Niallia circulans]AYV70519.1 hypothetical protein C2H98_02535 [Niallia circulans]
MKILISQPKMENSLQQLTKEIERFPEVDVILFPEGYFTADYIEEVCNLAIKHHTYIVTGYKDKNKKDRAFIANRAGKIILERAKTPENEILYTPSKQKDENVSFGYLLCREIFQGVAGLENGKVEIIFNPIGVGMFSEKQYEEWTSEARKIAMKENAIVVGTSHADGSYRNGGFSIPIAYCFDQEGNDLLLSKDDIRTRIFDTETNSIKIAE